MTSPESDLSAHHARWGADDTEPLALRWSDGPTPWRLCEFSSRGDRIVGRLCGPSGAGNSVGRPASGAGEACLALVVGPDAATLPPLPDLATATLDLPLRGSRTSPKWSERLAGCLQRGPADALERSLLEAFLEQSAADLQRLLDVCAHARGPGTRVGVIGLAAGALAGAVVRAVDPRVACTVLAPDGLHAALDPKVALGATDTPAVVLAGDDPARAAAWSAALGTEPRPGHGLPEAGALLVENLS